MNIYRIQSIIITSLFLSSSCVLANNTNVEELQHKIKERDKVILELLQRVENLERRVGVSKRDPQKITPIEKDMSLNGEATIADSRQIPGKVQVVEEDAERALERTLTQDGAVLLPSGVFEIQPSLVYSHNENATPAIINYNGDLFTGETKRKVDSVIADFGFRLGLPMDSQLEFGIPIQWRNIKTVNNIGFVPVSNSENTGHGLGDIRIGLAKTILREGLYRPDVVGRITWDTDTGDDNDNGISLGNGFNELQASISLLKRQDPLVFFGGFSYEYAFEENQIQPGATYLANAGSYIALSPETSLSFVFSGGYQTETKFAGSDVNGSDRTLGTLTIGTATLLGKGTLLNVSAGIGLTEDAEDFSISVSLPVRLGKKLF